jgi:OOP family OmpA-OmpF porin
MTMKFIITILFAFAACTASAQDYKIENNEVKIRKSILFETGSAKLLPESDEALAIIKKYLEDKSYISLLRVEGHTDNSGEPGKDQQLSEKRAMAVCSALVKLGVDCKRLIAVGFGSSKPVEENSTPEGKAANRRISFVNAALRGRMIGGLPADGGGKVAGDSCLN